MKKAEITLNGEPFAEITCRVDCPQEFLEQLAKYISDYLPPSYIERCFQECQKAYMNTVLYGASPAAEFITLDEQLSKLDPSTKLKDIELVCTPAKSVGITAWTEIES